MRKLTKFFTVAAMAMTVAVISKADFASAAQIVGLHQTDEGTSSVEFSWDADLAVNTASSGRYKVEISQDKTSWVESKVVSYANTYINDLTPGKSYYVRVTGYKDSDCKEIAAEPSEPLEVVTSPDYTNMTVTQSDAATNSITLSYSDVTGANWFVIKDGDTVLASSSNPKIKVANCSAGKMYSLRAYACRKSESGYVTDNSYNYKYINAKTLTKQPSLNQFGITNSWFNINSYKLEVSNTIGSHDGVQFQFLNLSGKAKKTVTTTSDYAYVDKFVNGTFYKYRARTFVKCGASNKYSKWSSVRTIAMPKSISGTASSKKVIRMNWGKISGASGFDVYISNKQHSGYKKVKSLSAKNRSITIKKYGKKALKKGHTYYLRLIPKAKSGKKTIKAQIYWSGYVRVPNY